MPKPPMHKPAMPKKSNQADLVGKEGVLRPRQIRSQKTLDNIIKSSLELVAARSYEEVSIADIAEHASMSVGGFYSRFENKEALFKTLYGQLAAETHARIAQAYALDWSAKPLADLVHHIVAGNAELYQKYRGILKVSHIQSHAQNNSNTQIYNAEIVRLLETLLLTKREAIQHERPREAIRVAIACMTAMLREAIVLGQSSLYRGSSTPAITRQVTQVISRYLAG